MHPSYRADELFKVRDRMRRSNHIIHKMHMSEAAVHDHVLRSSSSNVSAPSRSQPQSLHSTFNRYDHYERIPPDDFVFHGQRLRGPMRRSKSSPSASIKKGKAAKLVKEHGSPPGVRVTAGGRIVPHGLPALSSPRFGPGPSDDAGAHNVPYQVNRGLAPADRIVDPWLQSGPEYSHITTGGYRPENALPTGDMSGYDMSGLPVQALYYPWLSYSSVDKDEAGMHVQSARSEYRAVENELKLLDKAEVLNRSHLTRAQEEQNTRRRILLTNRLDSIRKSLHESRRAVLSPDGSQMREGLPDNQSSAWSKGAQRVLDPRGLTASRYSNGLLNPGCSSTYSTVYPSHSSMVSQGTSPSSTEIQHRIASRGGGIDHTAFSTANLIAQSKANKGSDVRAASMQMLETKAPVPAQDEPGMVNTYTGKERQSSIASYRPRRSHALEIKRPQACNKRTTSALDPESPAYRPASSSGPVDVLVSDVTSMKDIDKPVSAQDKLQGCSEHTVSSDRSGSSSISTTDFFPNDPSTYSLRKYRPTATNQIPGSLEEGHPCDIAETITAPDGKHLCEGPNTHRFLAKRGGTCGVSEDTRELCSLPQDLVDNINLMSSMHQQTGQVSSVSSVDGSGQVENSTQTSDPFPQLSISPEDERSTVNQYKLGYRCGLARKLPEDNFNSSEFYEGYRDGLFRSAQVALTLSGRSGGDVVSCNEQKEADLTTGQPVVRAVDTATNRSHALISVHDSPSPVRSITQNVQSVPPDAGGENFKHSSTVVHTRQHSPKNISMSRNAPPSPLSMRLPHNQLLASETFPVRDCHLSSYSDQRSPSKVKSFVAYSINDAQSRVQLDGNGGVGTLLSPASPQGVSASPNSRPPKSCSSPSKSFGLSSLTSLTFRSKKDDKSDLAPGKVSPSKSSSTSAKRRLSLAFGSPKKTKQFNN